MRSACDGSHLFANPTKAAMPKLAKKSKKHSAEEDDVDESIFLDDRHFAGKNGHTMRRVTYKMKHGDPIVERSARAVADVSTVSIHGARSQKLIPVTEVDGLFDDGFVGTGRRQYGGFVRPLKTLEAQTSVVDALEALAVKKVVSYHHWDDECNTHYDVPVIGHMIPAAAKKDAEPPKHWLYYAGVHWDPDVLYAYYGSESLHGKASLKPLCPLMGTEAFGNRVSLGRIEDGLNRIAAKAFTPPSSYASLSIKGRKKQRKQQMKRSHKATTEIDLGDVFEITQIGTLAGYPAWKHIHFFPPRDSVTDPNVRSYPISRGRGRNNRYPHVKIVHPESIGWLTEYSIQYRHVVTRQWHDLRDRLSGNVNMRDEVRHNVSVLTRYIRIVPHTWYQHMTYTVLVYGHRAGRGVGLSASINEKKAAHKRGQQRGADADAEGSQSRRHHLGDEEQVETVRYTLTPQQYTPYRKDGNGNTHYWYDDDDVHFKARQTILQNMWEDMGIMEAA